MIFFDFCPFFVWREEARRRGERTEDDTFNRENEEISSMKSI
jgi:hypothetical protein